MTFDEAMKALEAAGTAQTRKTYARHGVGENMFGVSWAVLGKMTKQIKCDHALAVQLWNSGNYDARILATMIADPAQLKSSVLEKWAKELDSYCLTDAFAGMVAKSPHARAKADKWRSAKGEWVASTGWRIVAHLAMSDPAIPDAYFEGCARTIERDIHSSKNRVRYNMNVVLIGIGIRNPKLTKLALAAAKRIGRVIVDHGETGCKTPDAADYIAKTLARKTKAKGA